MYCNYCGKPLNPGEVCSCQQPQQYQPAYNNGAYFSTEPASPAIAILRKHGSSPLMLFTAILYAVSILLSVVSTIVMSNTTMDIMSYNDPNFPQDFAAGGTIAMTVWAILGNVINYVAIGALFSLYRNCKKPVDSYIKTGGLTFFKVLSVIAIVAYSFAILMTVILGIVMIALGSELAYEMEYLLYDYGMSGMDMGTVFGIFFAVLFFILAGVFVFAIIVQASLIKTINSLKKTCRTGEPAMKISRFYAVMLIISASCTILSIPMNFIGTVYIMGALTVIMYSLMSAAMAAVTIMGAVLLFRVRRDMTDYVMSTVQPSYMPPVNMPMDGPTAYYYNPQQPQYTAPVEPVYEAPTAEPVVEPEVGETTILEMTETPAPVVPEIEIPAEKPTAEPVAEAAEELINEPTDVVCPACGNTYSAVANFCIYCGAPNPNK